LDASVVLKNTGDRDGDETVEFYLIPKAAKNAPLRTLVGFEKVHVLKGESETVHIAIGPRQLSLVNADGSRSVQPGEYELYVGGGQPSVNTGVFLPFHIDGQSPVAP
jgi:beta-glucosidase